MDDLSMDKIRLGISTCLLGEKVRYDGQHKHDRFLTDTLGQYVDYVPVCPEVECGLPVPREAMRLVGAPDDPRLVTVRTGRDLTDQMKGFSARRVRELEAEDLDGYIFKAKSPSSGMERVKVYDPVTMMPHKKGVGLFARAFMDHFPLLPVEEEGRLHDVRLRERFIERIFVQRRWRAMVNRPGVGRGDLVAFHTAHKLLVMAHSPKHYRELGRIVGAARRGEGVADLLDRYQRTLAEALALMATPAKHQNVLQHCMGYFKRVLAPGEKQELLEVIEQFRAGHLPLIVPVTLIKHYVRKYDQPYLAGQVYLDPHPLELKLRNHA